jgi:hypothetical protein
MESNMQIPPKNKNLTAIQFNDTTSGINSKECALGHNRATCTLVFIATLFTVDKL